MSKKVTLGKLSEKWYNRGGKIIFIIYRNGHKKSINNYTRQSPLLMLYNTQSLEVFLITAERALVKDDQQARLKAESSKFRFSWLIASRNSLFNNHCIIRKRLFQVLKNNDVMIVLQQNNLKSSGRGNVPPKATHAELKKIERVSFSPAATNWKCAESLPSHIIMALGGRKWRQ